jgi:hypothetical protein
LFVCLFICFALLWSGWLDFLFCFVLTGSSYVAQADL